jgi:2-polyprenyl-3-methyl-5-hydroxy-6-metoxy-1,4-benzoquinol methylase
LDPSQRLSPSEEKARYETHENDIQDPKYQEFVRPLVKWIQEIVKPGASGLDFGAGTGPILESLFQKDGYEMDKYDPFYWPNGKTLQKQYDFVVASEVAEHFSDPEKEFTLLNSLLKPGGVLGLMTLMHEAQTEIETWYYLKDPTHICAYSQKTFEWVQEHFSFSKLEIKLPRMVVLRGTGCGIF